MYQKSTLITFSLIFIQSFNQVIVLPENDFINENYKDLIFHSIKTVYKFVSTIIITTSINYNSMSYHCFV